jgi:hypothetical protein
MTALAGVGRPAPEKHKYSGDRQGVHSPLLRLDVIVKDVSVLVDVRTRSVNDMAKNPRKLRAGNLRIFDVEEIRQLVYPLL